MRITSEEVHALVASGPVLAARVPKRRSIDRQLSQLRRSMRTAIDQHMQAQMVMLEEAIRFLMAFESFHFNRGLNKETNALALQIVRLRSGAISIRELIMLGQQSTALALARVFFEDIEIAMGLAIDPDFSLAYLEAPNESDFWAKKIGYGNIYPKVEKFLKSGGGDEDEVRGRLQHHKKLKSFLSGHIHPTTSSAMRLAFPLALQSPGRLQNRPLGSLGDNLSPLCLLLVEEVHSFAASCINMFIGADPPPALSGYSPCKELHEFLTAAHVLQELIVKHSDLLQERHDEAVAAWMTEADIERRGAA